MNAVTVLLLPYKKLAALAGFLLYTIWEQRIISWTKVRKTRFYRDSSKLFGTNPIAGDSKF